VLSAVRSSAKVRRSPTLGEDGVILRFEMAQSVTGWEAVRIFVNMVLTVNVNTENEVVKLRVLPYAHLFPQPPTGPQQTSRTKE
jgi:hypothetical protein